MAASSTACLQWLLIKVIEDVKSGAPIEAPVVYSETNVNVDGSLAIAQVDPPAVYSEANGGAGGSSAVAPAEAPILSTETNVNSGGSSAAA